MYQEVLPKEPDASYPWRCVQFDSVYDFTRRKTESSCPQLWKDSVEEVFNGNRAPGGSILSWFGCNSRAEFDEILNKGHKKYVDLIYEKQLQINPPKTLKRKKIGGDFGDELDIHQVLTGNLGTAWKKKSPKVKVSSRNIHLVVNGSQNCSINADQLQWIGVTALRAAETFESCGYNVAIDMIYSSINISDKEHICLMVPVKVYDQPLDIQQLTSCICFPGFFRGPGFMNYGLAAGTIMSGYGRAPDDSILAAMLPKYYTNPAEVIEIVSNKALSREAAEQEIARILDKYGYHEAQAA